MVRMNEQVIHIEDLLVRAEKRIILSVERLSISCGQVVGIIGPNGAGKTTLLKCILGYQRFSTGKVVVFGRPVRSSADMPGPSWSGFSLSRLRRRIGYVPQVLAREGEMPLTVREVVSIGRCGLVGLIKPLRREDWRIVDEWLDRLGLAELANAGYGDLSGGEQRKVLIARAMVQQPELLILDEPTANLDLSWREQIVAEIEHLCQQSDLPTGSKRGLTVILVCHELEVIPSCCHHIVLLERGRISAQGRPEEVLTDERIKSLYGSGLKLLQCSGRFAVIPAGEQ